MMSSLALVSSGDATILDLVPSLIFTLPKHIGDATRWEASSDAIAIAID